MKLNVWQALSPAVALLLVGCASLPKELKREITEANTHLAQAEKQLKSASDEVAADLKHSPDLFTAVASDWRNRLDSAKSKLSSAANDRTELEKLEKSGTKEAAVRARQVLNDVERLRKTAIDEADSVQAQATRWLDFQRNLPHYLAKMREEHDASHTADFSAITKTIEKAEQDWPAKKADLEKRLEDLTSTPDRAEAEWKSTEADRQAAADGKATGAQVATLIQADDILAASARLPEEANELAAISGQLYNSWDKILDDLDVTHEGADTVYREKLKTVRTRFAEAGDNLAPDPQPTPAGLTSSPRPTSPWKTTSAWRSRTRTPDSMIPKRKPPRSPPASPTSRRLRSARISTATGHTTARAASGLSCRNT